MGVPGFRVRAAGGRLHLHQGRRGWERVVLYASTYSTGSGLLSYVTQSWVQGSYIGKADPHPLAASLGRAACATHPSQASDSNGVGEDPAYLPLLGE